MSNNCYSCKFFEEVNHRGQRYPKGHCKKHYYYRISDGYKTYLSITGVDEHICDLYEPAPVPTYAMVNEELYLIPPVIVDELVKKGWVKVQLTERGKMIVKKEGGRDDDV